MYSHSDCVGTTTTTSVSHSSMSSSSGSHQVPVDNYVSLQKDTHRMHPNSPPPLPPRDESQGAPMHGSLPPPPPGIVTGVYHPVSQAVDSSLSLDNIWPIRDPGLDLSDEASVTFSKLLEDEDWRSIVQSFTVRYKDLDDQRYQTLPDLYFPRLEHVTLINFNHDQLPLLFGMDAESTPSRFPNLRSISWFSTHYTYVDCIPAPILQTLQFLEVSSCSGPCINTMLTESPAPRLTHLRMKKKACHEMEQGQVPDGLLRHEALVHVEITGADVHEFFWNAKEVTICMPSLKILVTSWPMISFHERFRPKGIESIDFETPPMDLDIISLLRQTPSLKSLSYNTESVKYLTKRKPGDPQESPKGILEGKDKKDKTVVAPYLNVVHARGAKELMSKKPVPKPSWEWEPRFFINRAKKNTAAREKEEARQKMKEDVREAFVGAKDTIVDGVTQLGSKIKERFQKNDRQGETASPNDIHVTGQTHP